jgi:predicted RNA-binding Zn-ribbon protein involved in translation (DUF1610 family)
MEQTTISLLGESTVLIEKPTSTICVGRIEEKIWFGQVEWVCPNCGKYIFGYQGQYPMKGLSTDTCSYCDTESKVEWDLKSILNDQALK